MDSTIVQNDQVFSIDDLAVVHYHKVSEQELKNQALAIHDPLATRQNQHLLNAFLYLSEESNQAIFTISAQNSELASYLNTLDIKINLLAHAILTPENKRFQEPQKIMLNQHGLAFGTNERVSSNELVIIKFILSPSYQMITLVARVIDCIASSDNPQADINFEFWAYVSFENISPIQDQWIAKHILNKQLEEIRKNHQR